MIKLLPLLNEIRIQIPKLEVTYHKNHVINSYLTANINGEDYLIHRTELGHYYFRKSDYGLNTFQEIINYLDEIGVEWKDQLDDSHDLCAVIPKNFIILKK